MYKNVVAHNIYSTYSSLGSNETPSSNNEQPLDDHLCHVGYNKRRKHGDEEKCRPPSHHGPDKHMKVGKVPLIMRDDQSHMA
jgi:hypothetical protein